MPLSLDDLRERFPLLGFCLYAIDPAGPVTFEIHADGEVYTFTEATEAAAIEAAFPVPPEDEPEDEQPTPTTNVFD